jgi:hypothetical protein
MLSKSVLCGDVCQGIFAYRYGPLEKDVILASV